MSRLQFSLDQSPIPEYMHGGIIRYIEKGINPGSFLAAVIENDLRSAAENADISNQRLLFEYVAWFYNYAPAGSWGYAGAISYWREHLGKEKAETAPDLAVVK